MAPETVELGGFDEALALARGFPEPVLVAGSLFLVGQARARLTDGEFQRSSQ